MAGNIIDMSRIKQLLQLKKLGLSNRQIAKELKISRDKTGHRRTAETGRPGSREAVPSRQPGIYRQQDGDFS